MSEFYATCQHCGAKPWKSLFTIERWSYVLRDWRQIDTQWQSVKASWGQVFTFCSTRCRMRELGENA